jgi:signal transduction histidine kinase
MKSFRFSGLVYGTTAFFVGGYAAALLIPRGAFQTEVRDLLECVVPLFANGCLLSNANSPYRKQNTFWKLLALACTLLLAGRLIRTYDELVRHQTVLSSLPTNAFPFLHMIPLMAALGFAPHTGKMREGFRYASLDLTLLASFWIYLYVFCVIPWETVWPDATLFHRWNAGAFSIQILVAAAGFGILCLKTKGDWRGIYGNIAGATVLYGIGPLAMIEGNLQHAGAIQGLAYVGSVVWLGAVGLKARDLSLAPASDPETGAESQWQVGLSTLAVVSIPLLGGWAAFGGHAPASVRTLQLTATLIAMFVCSGLAFFRQHLAHQERAKLVKQLSTSLDNVKRLQTQFVQSEKLAALGQLAAGAAHEINNPLTAIVGYSDLLLAEHAPATRAHALGQKIQEQARRTKSLVMNLLSFARQVPSEKQLLDLRTVLDSAVQLRKIDAHSKSIRIEFENHNSVLPAVRGDPNQLLQVFYHLIGNASDAMETIGGGVLLIRALAEKGAVVIEFSDTGPGMKDPEKVFDPFYTTKAIGKGTGLGLSICYGIMQEHGGKITGFNRPEGGCTFRLELPAALASVPRASLTPLSQRSH